MSAFLIKFYIFITDEVIGIEECHKNNVCDTFRDLFYSKHLNII